MAKIIRLDVKEKLDAYCEDVGQMATLALKRILDDYLIKNTADKGKCLRR